MPNHITNRITAPEELLAKYVGKTDDGEPTFDFSQLIPMPEELVMDAISGGTKMVAELALGLIDLKSQQQMPKDPMANMGAAAAVLHRSNALRRLTEGPMAKDLDSEQFEIMVRLMRSYRACGEMDWYDWNNANWGTKWNAYDVKLASPGILLFDTAWSAPHPVIAKLALESGSQIKHEWADEDTGSNVGYIQYRGGNVAQAERMDDSKAGYELAFELRPRDSENYHWNDIKNCYEWFDVDES